MTTYTREEIKGLLCDVGIWNNEAIAMSNPCGRSSIPLLQAAPMLAHQLLNVMNELEQLKQQKLCSMCSNKLSEGATKMVEQYGEAMKNLAEK